MPSRKKKSSKTTSQNEVSFEGDEASSTTSESSTGSSLPNNTEEQTAQEMEHTLDTNIDLLTEKRYSVREAAWEAIIRLMRWNYLEEMVASRQDTLVDMISRAARKGSDAEATTASLCSGILAFTLGPNAQSFVSTVDPVFAEIVTNRSKSTPTRVSVLQAATAVIFVCSIEPTNTTEWLNRSFGLFGEGDPILRQAAIEAWCLLVTSLGTGVVVNDLIPSAMPRLWKLLQDSDIEVKVAAGKAIALLIEIAKDHKESAEEDFDLYSLRDTINVDELLDLFHDLADGYVNFSKGKVKQRNVFREISKFVDSWESPSESLSVRRQKISFVGWSKLAQLKAFKELLGCGFQTHIESNNTLADILSFELKEKGAKQSLSALEKRLFRSPNSAQAKAQTESRAKGRAIRQGAIYSAED